MNNTTGNLLVTGLGDGNVKNFGEFDIPALSTSLTITDLNIAASTQDFTNVIDNLPLNTSDEDDINGVTLFGLFEKDNKIIFNYARYYDNADGGSNTISQEVCGVKEDATDITDTSEVKGAFEYDNGNLGCGWISPIPAAWQAALGGTHISGFSSGTTRAIISRLSLGPSAYVMDPDDLINPIPANGTQISTTTLMEFPYPNSMGVNNPANVDSELSSAGSIWNFISETNYGFIVPGTDTYLCIGFDGGFNSGVGYKLRNNTTGVDTGDWDAVDPNDYRNIYMMFDVNDLVDAKNGVINPYDIVPYEMGEISIPYGGSQQTLKRVSGATYDTATGRLYIALLDVDGTQGQLSNQPIIVAYTF
jgi:hypothetical protein